MYLEQNGVSPLPKKKERKKTQETKRQATMRCGSRGRVHEVYRKTDKHENPRADQGRPDRVIERFEVREQLAQTHGCIPQPVQQASLHQAPCIYVQDAVKYQNGSGGDLVHGRAA